MKKFLKRSAYHFRLLSLFTILGAVSAVGCDASGDTSIDENGDLIDSEGNAVETTDGDSGSGKLISGDDPKSGSTDDQSGGEVGMRDEVCDSQGNCTCLRLALLGTLDSAAADTNSSTFQAWLNGNSGGTATVDMITEKPTLSAGFLDPYDVLILANLNGWTFSDAEKAAVIQWSAAGGGIIAITGFESTATESASSSQLIEFSGLGFTGTAEADFSAHNGQSEPVYYNGGTEDLTNCLGWSGSSDAIITTPIPFSPQTGDMAALTFELDYVGAYIGWGVATPPEATVVATDPVSGQNIAVATQVDNAGKVYAFGDEWIIFANQWEPEGNPNNTQEDEYNICYHMPETDNAETFFHSVQTLYQTKQFWYNAITWVAPPNECTFIVEDKDVVVIR